MKYDFTHLLWDWNGTLLDDLQLCIRLLGDLLASQGLPPVSKERYLEIFDFPISEYYQKAGFDFSKESYESLAKRYMQIYPRAGCWLGPVPGMLPVVEQLHRLGIYQGILSASDRQILLQQLSYSGYPEKWFREVLGLENFYGVSKVALGQRWMEQSGISPEQVIYVGDTTHDAETAQAMGCRCILVGWGHQSVEKLEKAGVPLALTPQQLLQMLLGR